MEESPLDEACLDPDPIRQFQAWLRQAEAVYGPGSIEATTALLATASPEGVPSARAVLLKGVDARGFVFYTNYGSRKARELEANPRAALVFWWPRLLRQVRVEGRVERTSPAESDAYFATRPRESQLASWASPQSAVIPDRAFLERRVREFGQRFPEVVPRPPFWGGFRVLPEAVEFWQGRKARLHDRFLYTRTPEGWRVHRLAP